MKLIDAYLQMTIQAVTMTQAMTQGRVLYDHDQVRGYELCMVLIYDQMCLDGPDAPISGNAEALFMTQAWSD